MKVVTAKTMAEVEDKAYHLGFSEEGLMEKAGLGIAQKVMKTIDHHQWNKNVLLLCGKGNNAGDAYVAGYHLLQHGYSVGAIQLQSLDACSLLCQKNGNRFIRAGGKEVSFEKKIGGYSVLIDGIFGTGFKGEVKEPYKGLIEAANESKIPIMAVDIPSGLDGTSGEVKGTVTQATETIFLGFPKTGFFLKDGFNYIGKLQGVDFELPKKIMDEAVEDFNLLMREKIVSLLPPIKRVRQKYEAGYVIGLASSHNMPGAGLLSSLSALRTGCGIIRLLHPEGMQAELANSPYEVIKVPYSYSEGEKILALMNKGKANYVGPGLGRSEEVKKLLNVVMPHLEKPCVIDADALTLYSENAFELPKEALFTPHTGEMQSLLHKKEKLTIDSDTLKICQQYCEEKNITLVLKGAVTFIFHPGSPIQMSTPGDPGMATAGSGDVLTGMIASLLSQGLSCHQAAQVGVYLHGLAGELAVKARGTSYGLIASDITSHIHKAFARLSSY